MNMAKRALTELRPGDVVNLGVGIPTLVADLITPHMAFSTHRKRDVGRWTRAGGRWRARLSDQCQQDSCGSALPGASYFDSATSFAMIHGGHVDVAIMGGLQVDEAAGNPANWAVPGKPLLGVGGGHRSGVGRRAVVLMEHVTREGEAKLVPTLHVAVDSNGSRGCCDHRFSGLPLHRW